MKETHLKQKKTKNKNTYTLCSAMVNINIMLNLFLILDVKDQENYGFASETTSMPISPWPSPPGRRFLYL
jgi:hypothetical protein